MIIIFIAASIYAATPPPARYDHPAPGIEMRLPLAEVQTLCWLAGLRSQPAHRIQGCTSMSMKISIVPDDDDGTVSRHERGHRNGAVHNAEWPR